jgi:phytanoyl-CoA hydroxylase
MGMLDDGYVLIKQAFDVRNLVEDIEYVFNLYNPSSKSFDESLKELFSNDFDGFLGCANSCQYLPSLFSIASSKTMMSLLKDIGLKKPIINTRPLLSFSSKYTSKNENYWKVPIHQDWPSMQGSLNGVTCWVPLVDVDDLLGPLEISPASHKLGMIPHEDEGVPYIKKLKLEFIPIPMNAGDALFFNTFTVHKSGNNYSKRIRLTSHFRYDDCEEPSFIDRKYPRHRIEKRKEGLLHPNFPSYDELNKYFNFDKFHI